MGLLAAKLRRQQPLPSFWEINTCTLCMVRVLFAHGAAHSLRRGIRGFSSRMGLVVVSVSSTRASWKVRVRVLARLPLVPARPRTVRPVPRLAARRLRPPAGLVGRPTAAFVPLVAAAVLEQLVVVANIVPNRWGEPGRTNHLARSGR